MRAKGLALAGILALALASGGVARSEPVTIRLSYIVPVSNWATILFERPELAHHLGKSYAYEAVHFQNTSLLFQGLAAGEVDIANLGFTTFPKAITNAGMSDLRIIADELQDGVPGYYSDEYMVLKDGSVKTVADLKGKIVADGGLGSGLDIPLRVMLAEHHLEDKRDFTVVEAPIPTLPAELLDHKVDLIALPRPFTANPKTRAATRTLFTQGEAMGGITELSFWVARESFIAKHRAAMLDFMEDALRAERWYLDPAHHDEALKIAVDVTRVPAPVWNSWLFRKDGENGDYYRAPDGKPDIAALQKSIDVQKQYGLLTKTIDVAKYLDLSLVDEAAKRLE